MKVINGSSLKEALSSAGFSRSEQFENKDWLNPAEKLYVFMRPDAVYAHVRVDTSGERPRVHEIGLEAESRYFSSQDENIDAKLVDGIWVVSARYTDPGSPPAQVAALESYLASVSDTIASWRHLAEHKTLVNVVTGKGTYEVAPWLKQLPLEHRMLLSPPAPTLLDIGDRYRVAF